MKSQSATRMRTAQEQDAHLLLREVVAASRSHQADVERRIGLAAAQVRLLAVVKRRPQITVGECAGHLGLSMPTVSNLLRALVARKWIRAVTDPADKRRLRLAVTAAGARRISGRVPFATGMLPAVIAKLSDHSLSALIAGLRPLVDVIPTGYRRIPPARRRRPHSP